MWIWRAEESTPRRVNMPPGKGGGLSTAPGLSSGDTTAPGKSGSSGSSGGGGPVTGFPQVSAVETGTKAPQASSADVTLPVGSGTMFVVIVRNGSWDANSIDWPAGWTELVEKQSFGSLSVGVRVKDGSEGSTITVSTPVHTVPGWAWVAYDIDGPTALTSIEGAVDPWDPPNLSPSWGEDDNLWLAVASTVEDGDFTAPPTNYTNMQKARTGGSTDYDCAVATAQRELAAASEDPGAFSSSTLNGSSFATLAMKAG